MMALHVLCVALAAALFPAAAAHDPAAPGVHNHGMGKDFMHRAREDALQELENENSLRDAMFVRDREHTREHLRDMRADLDTDNMAEDELDFYFFKIHDTDGDRRLDGLELLAAFLHAVHDHYDEVRGRAGPDGGGLDLQAAAKVMDRIIAHFEKRVDLALSEDDADGDGYISYSEFGRAAQLRNTLRKMGE